MSCRLKQIFGITVFLAAAGMASAIFGPPPAVDLDHQGGTSQGDFGRAIGFDAAGNIYLALSVEAPYQGQTAKGSGDAVVQKMSPDGTILWARQVGTNKYDSVGSIAVTAGGTSMLVGHSQGVFTGQANAGFDDLYVVVHDTDGNQLGLDQYGGTSSEYIHDVTTDGTYFYVVGSTYGTIPGQTSSGGQDATVYKYDANAALISSVQFGTTGGEEGLGITLDPVAGRLYVAGYTSGSFTPGNGSNDGFVAVLDLNVNVLQTANAGSAASDFIHGIELDAAGNLYTAGRSFSGGVNSLWIASFDSSLVERWSRTFTPSSGTNWGYGIAVAADGTNYTVGEVHQLPGHAYASQAKAGVLSLDATGNDRWNDQFGSVVGTTEGYGIGLDPSGRATLVGRTQGVMGPEGSQGGYDYFLRRYAAETGGSNVIDDCAVIATPGTWQLGQDLTCAGVAVEVQADGVTLDMNGYSIFFSSDGQRAIGVLADGVTNFVLQDSSAPAKSVNADATGGSAIEQVDFATGAKGISAEFSYSASLSDVSVTVNGADGTTVSLSDSEQARASAMYLRYENANGKVMDISRSTAAEILGLSLTYSGAGDLALSAWASSGASVTDTTIQGPTAGTGTDNGIEGAGISGMTLTRVAVTDAGVNLDGDNINATDLTVDGGSSTPSRSVVLRGGGTFLNGSIRRSKVRLGGRAGFPLRLDGVSIVPIEEIVVEDHVELAGVGLDLTGGDLGVTLENRVDDSVVFDAVVMAVAIERALGRPLFENLYGNTARMTTGMILRTARSVAEVVGEIDIAFPFPFSLGRLEGENRHLTGRSAQIVDDLGAGDRTFYNYELAMGAGLHVMANDVDVSAQCSGDDHIATCPAATAAAPAVYTFGLFNGVYSCGLLVGPGNYDLMNDLASQGGVCLLLQGDDVKLNGMGYAISVTGGTEAAPASAVHIDGDRALMANLNWQLGSGFNIAVTNEPMTSDTTIRDSQLLSGDGDDVGLRFSAVDGVTLQRVTGTKGFVGLQLDYTDVDALVVEDSTFEEDVSLRYSYGRVSRSYLGGNVTASSTPAEPPLRFESGTLGREGRTLDLGDNVYLYDSAANLGREGRFVNSATHDATPVRLVRTDIRIYNNRLLNLLANTGGEPPYRHDFIRLVTTNDAGVTFGAYGLDGSLDPIVELQAAWDYIDADSSEIGDELDGPVTIRIVYPGLTTPADPSVLSMHISFDPADPFDLGACWPTTAAGAILELECYRDFGTGLVVVGEIHTKICGDSRVNAEFPGDCGQPGTENCDLDCNFIAPNPEVEITKGAQQGEVELNWTGPAGSWMVYRSLDPSDVVGAGTLLTTTAGTTYTDASPDDGQTYYYEVVAGP